MGIAYPPASHGVRLLVGVSRVLCIFFCCSAAAAAAAPEFSNEATSILAISIEDGFLAPIQFLLSLCINQSTQLFSPGVGLDGQESGRAVDGEIEALAGGRSSTVHPVSNGRRE